MDCTNFFILRILLALSVLAKMVYPLDNLPLNANFGQIQEFRQYIVEDDEVIFIDLNDYFRGNFLNFTVTSTNSSQQIVEQQAVQIWNPVQLKNTFLLREPLQTPLTTVRLEALYSNQQNQYFIYIDEQLNLVVLDVSTYYLEESQNINKVTSKSLYNTQFLSATRKVCAHLQQIESGSSVFLVFCLSNLGTQNATGISIDFNVPDYPSISYFNTPLLFSEVLSGDLYCFQGDIKDRVLMLQTADSAKSSSFKIYEVFQQKMSLIQEIKNLTYRLNADSQEVIYSDLQITDIAVSKNMVYISDYLKGIFATQINCSLGQLCLVNTFSLLIRYKVEKLEITDNSTRIIATISAPTELVEIDIQDINNPYVYRILSIKSDQKEYFCLSLLDTNPSYIAVQMLRVEDMKPVIRIYTRSGPFKSFGVQQFDYTKVYSDGHFMKFLDFNHLIIKTSDTLQLYKIRRHQMLIDASKIQSIPFIYNNTVTFNLNVRDYLENYLTIVIHAKFQRKISDRTEVIRTLPPKLYLNSSQPQIYYTCGMFQSIFGNRSQDQVFPMQNLDNIFSGTNRYDYSIKYQGTDEGIDYNFLQARNSKYLGDPTSSGQVNLRDCQQTGLVRFINGNYFDNQLACIARTKYQISFYDIIDDGDATVQPNIFQQDISQTPRPSAFIIDQKNQLIFGFTIVEISNSETPWIRQVLWNIQFFKIYNILAWLRKEDVDPQIANLAIGYKLDSINSIVYNKYNRMGLIRFRAVNSQQSGDVFAQIFVFKIDDPTNYLNSMTLLSRLVITLRGPVPPDVIDMKIAETGNLWVALSNGLILEYQVKYRGKINLQSQNPDEWFEQFIQLKMEKQVQKQLKAIDGWSGKLVIFQGKNEILLAKLDQTRILIKTNISLPLSYTQSEQVSFEKNLQFCINSQGQVVYQIEKNYLFVLYNDTLDPSTYYLIVYEINSWRHNVILLEMRKFTSGIFVDPNDRELNIHLYSDSENFDDSQVTVMIQTSNGVLKQNMVLHPQIEITLANATRLDQLCKRQSLMDLKYEICPIGQNQNCVNYTLKASNNGLILKKNTEKPVKFVINQLTKDQEKIRYKDRLVDAIFPTLMYFEGYNMLYDYKLISEKSDTGVKFSSEEGDKASNIQTFDLKTYRRNITIEFISKNNKLIDFFQFGSVLVILDHDGYFNVITDLDGNVYQRLKSEDFLGCAPSLYTVLYGNYLMYQCDQKDEDGRVRFMFGITKIYGVQNRTQLTLDDAQLENEYQVFKDFGGLMVKKTVPQLQLNVPVTRTCVYEKPNTSRNDSEVNNITAIISYDIPGDNYQSVIIVYALQFNHSQYITDLNPKTRYISIARNYLNTFRVTSIEFIPGTDLLTIAILDYGLVIYSIEGDQVEKFVSLAEYVRYQPFRIQKLVMQDQYNMHLLLEKLGVISIGMQNGTIIQISTYFNFLEGELTSINKVGQHPQGFAFLTSQQISNRVTIEKIFRVRFFSFYDSNSKKLLAGREFQEGIYCDKLKSVPSDSIMIKDFEKTQNAMWNAFICGGDLYFFDFYVDLDLYFLHNGSSYFNKLQQQLELTVWNNFSQESIIINLEVSNESELASTSVILLFALFILLMVILVYLITHSIELCGKNQSKLKTAIQSKEEALDQNETTILTKQTTASTFLTTAQFQRKSLVPSDFNGVIQILN